jgi:hypothetical protein
MEFHLLSREWSKPSLACRDPSFQRDHQKLAKNHPSQKKTKALKDGAAEVELDVEGKMP